MIETLSMFFDPLLFFIMAGGVVCGLVVGAIPGLSATMAMALITPLTFSLDGAVAFPLLCSVYVGSISGGLYSAILLRIPGTSSSIATTFDGFPLARKGLAGEAIGAALVASFIGGTFSFLALGLFAPVLAMFALKFGPAEYFAVSLLGLSTIAAVLGSSTLKGLIAAGMGLLLGTVGLDVLVGIPRFTFGIVELTSGFDIMAILIGLFAVPQILRDLGGPDINVNFDRRMKPLLPSLKRLASWWGNFLRSSVIGTWIGLLPGAGGSIASLLAYDQARRASRNPEKFGEGEIAGVVASETANNAVIGGSLIPLLTLGIPGDTPAAVLLAALTIHGIQAGPLLYTTNPGTIHSILASLYFSNILMLVISFIGSRYIIRVLNFPKHVLLPMIVMMCVVGSYAINQRMFDVRLMIFIGLWGYVMEVYGFPTGPAVLGVILGPIIESNFRRAIQISGRGAWDIVLRPISGVVLLLVLLNFLWPFIQSRRARKKRSAGAAPGTLPRRWMRANRVFGLGCAALGVVVFILSSRLGTTALESPVYGPAFYPRILALVMAALGAALAIFPLQKGDPAEAPDMKKRPLTVGVLSLAAYAALMPLLGFVTMSTAYLAFSFVYFGGKPARLIPRFVLAGAAVSLGLYVLFEYLFNVFLPHGMLI